MTTAIVSLERPGTHEWAEVGMNYRTVVGPYKRNTFILKRAAEFAGAQPHRIEWFAGDNIRGEPYHITYHND